MRSLFFDFTKIICTLFKAKTHVTGLSFSPDGKQFVTVSPDRKVNNLFFIIFYFITEKNAYEYAKIRNKMSDIYIYILYNINKKIDNHIK